MAIQTSLKSDEFRNTIQESRQRFLDILRNDSIDTEDGKTRPNESIKKKTTSRKISFKVRKTASTYKKNTISNIQKTTITANSVSELASKFNDIIEKQKTPNDEVKLKKISIKLGNNNLNNIKMKQTTLINQNENHRKDLRKPSIKKKPIIDDKFPKVQIIRKKSSVTSKIIEIKKETTDTKINESTNDQNQIDQTTSQGFVKAAIQNFEKKNFQPFLTKRSMSELHTNLLNKTEFSTNRRRSCKPDFDVPAQETIKDQNKDIETETRIISKPNSQKDAVDYSQIIQDTEIISTKIETTKLLEAKKIKIPEPCYSMIDIADNLPVIEENNEQLTLDIKPNTSFLWTRCSSNLYQDIFSHIKPNFGTIGPNRSFAPKLPPLSNTLPRDFKGGFVEEKDKIYEELDTDGYEPFDLPPPTTNVQNKIDTQPKEESDYEYLQTATENIYEPLCPSKQNVPLPKRPSSKNEESLSNCYESIYSPMTDNNYETIYFRELSVNKEITEKDIAGSIVSSEQKTNSLYGTSLRSWNEGTIYNGSANSDISFSDKSEWIDVSENEDDGNSKIIIIREAVKNKKGTTWSQQCRQQWTKNSKSGGDSDSDHHYETLRTSEDEGHEDVCYDSFASDVESEDSFENLENHENNGDLPLPAAPNSNDVLTRLAASASKHMRKFTKNLSMTKSDISKSLTRITRRKSKNDISEVTEDNYDNINVEPSSAEMNPTTKTEVDENNEKNRTFSRKGILYKIRRSIIMSPEQASEITSHINKGKSTFYLTPTINIDDPDDAGEKKTGDDSGISLSPIDRERNSRNKPQRPQNPPPPAPIVTVEDLKKSSEEKRSTSWYADVNLLKGTEIKTKIKEKQSSTCWYDEIGLYQKSASTPSTSSAENSGTNTNVTITSINTSPITHQETEKYYNINSNNYYNNSMQSLNSNGTKTDLSLTSLPGDDIQMRLQNEPLYQFYDAAVLESACHEGISDLDSDNYEDVENRLNLEPRPPSRPSAMELIVPKRNSLAFAKTLWCEIPEVLQSSVLSTLSSHQKKLQEAKFEMVTSEASYLNSLNVLHEHFIKNLHSTLTDEEFDLLFSKIEPVRRSSDKLLLDLEKCWQDNILLHGVCDIIQKHAEADFSVYIPYCENHILLDQTMKKLRERPSFVETLKLLETSPVCQCLSLYSFLMLPMQRITRWPLLLDAVLKRLEQHDPEYLTCQYVLATINKIVSQCNEAARHKERELEMLSIESRMEFSKGVPPFEIVIPNRWLIKSGNVVHMQPKNEEIKLTFGKKISKVNLYLFLFNDLLIVAKPKGDNQYFVLHYCSRNFTELSTSEHLLSIPGKDMTGKYLFFLTILENQNQKTVEFLLSCSSESDRQRWIEALSPPKSEDPDEVLYECWDCPQVTVIHNYNAVQPDELTLSKGDIINVSRKMADGWFQGERIRDGQTGWFPANYTSEIANPHVRARNLKQRYRFLTFSENYLKNK